MFCAECGKANPDNAKFCEYCGSRLVSNVPNNNLPKQADSSFENGANQNIATEMKMPVMPETVFENESSVMPVSKLSILIVFEIIIVIAAVYAGKMIGDKYYNSEYLASQYFECLMNGHPDKAYEYCSKDNESDFISREMYCSVIGSGNKKILSYKISKMEQDLDVEKYEVVYRLAEDDSKYKMTITMKKNPDKKIFFIFDDWKVSMTDFICKDYIINVPKGVKVIFDNIVLTESNTEKIPDKEAVYATYKIGAVFTGDHVIEISRDYFQSVKSSIYISNDSEGENYYYLEQMYLEKSVLNELANDAKEKFKYIIKAAANGDYTSIIDQCVSKEGREYASNSLLQVIPDYFNKLEVNNISFNAADNMYDYYSEYNESYVAEVTAYAGLGYSYLEYGYEYDDYRDINAYFYYGFDDNGKFEIKSIEFDY